MNRPLCLASGLLGLIATAVVLAMLSAPHGVAAQLALPYDEDGTWITYTTADGLPSNWVLGGMAVDNAGQVWAGFANGDYGVPIPTNTLVSRWDGTAWMNYDLPGCRVRPLAAGQYVYAATSCPGPGGGIGGGLSWFTGSEWVTFTPTDGIAGTFVYAIASESDTRVWIATGYTQYDAEFLNLVDHKGTANKADDEWTVYNMYQLFSILSVDSIGIDPHGNRWFGTSNGVRVLSADGNTWITYTADLINWAMDIAFDEHGNVWFARGQKVIRFDGAHWTYYNSREEAIEANYAAILSSLNRNRVNPMWLPGLWAVEGQAGVWIIRWDDRGYSNGVAFYDGHTWKTYTRANSGLGSDIDVYGIAIDQQGSVWIGTAESLYNGPGGVDKFVPTPNFSMNAAPATFLVAPGNVVTSNVDLFLPRGWVPTVTLNATGLPSSTVAIFGANPVTPTTQVSFAISSTLDTPLGNYPISIVATGIGATRTSTITLLVVPEVFRYYWPFIIKNAGALQRLEATNEFAA
jgi:hypothetical protein